MMTVREATPSDIPVLAGFQQKMALETENVTLENAVLLEGFRQLFSDPHKGKYYVAELDETIIGCLMTTFEWSEWRNGAVLWIQSVYIHEEFRAQGVYKKMYTHIQEIVKKDLALKGIRLYADKKNAAAQRVYEKMGMNGDHYLVYEWMK